MKLRCMALDPNAKQALEISLSGDKEIYMVDDFDISNLARGDDAINLIITSHLDRDSIRLLEPIKDIDAKNILLYLDTPSSANLINELISLDIIPAPIQIESLATLAISSTLDIFIDILSEPKDNDIIFGIENPAKILKKGYFVSTWMQKGKSIESSMLSLVRTIWQMQSAYGIAMAIHVPPEMSLITLDELLDLLESRISPNSKLYVVYKNDLAKDEQPYINMLISRYLPKDTSFQELLDKEDNYLAKVALLVDWFANGVLSSNQAEMLAKDNAIEINDLQKIYSIIYDYPQKVANIIKELREASSDNSKIDIIVSALKEGIVDSVILEELAHTHNLPLDLIIKKIELESKQ